MTVISIIIPIFNEAATIIEILEKVRAQKIDGFVLETIIIDDGSTDGTRDILRQRLDLYDRFIELPRNGGKGAAVKAGLEHAKGDYILFQDADLEYDPADYAKLFEPVRRFDADIVMGSRMIAPPITRVSYFWHRVGNFFITFFFNILNNTTFSDIYTCYLLYRRTLVAPVELKTTGWEQQAEILSLAMRQARAIYEVPISYYGRTYAEGKKIRAGHVVAIFITIALARFRRTFRVLND